MPSNWSDTCNFCVPDSALYSPEKYTNGSCNDIQNPCPPGYDYSKSNTAKRYTIMGDALKAQNRTILYSLCQWGQAGVNEW